MFSANSGLALFVCVLCAKGCNARRKLDYMLSHRINRICEHFKGNTLSQGEGGKGTAPLTRAAIFPCLKIQRRFFATGLLRILALCNVRWGSMRGVVLRFRDTYCWIRHLSLDASRNACTRITCRECFIVTSAMSLHQTRWLFYKSTGVADRGWASPI